MAHDIEFELGFGNHLRLIREDKKISQTQLAIECDIYPSTLSRIETGIAKKARTNTIRCLVGKLGTENFTAFDLSLAVGQSSLEERVTLLEERIDKLVVDFSEHIQKSEYSANEIQARGSLHPSNV